MTKPLRKQTVHMVGREHGAILKLMAEDVTTVCGKVAAPFELGELGYTLLDSDGNRLRGTTRRESVSCQKCKNLLTIGALHVNTPHARQKRLAGGVKQ